MTVLYQDIGDAFGVLGGDASWAGFGVLFDRRIAGGEPSSIVAMAPPLDTLSAGFLASLLLGLRVERRRVAGGE